MRSICLVGNPNTGKTTFFNSLTKSNEHVGNWQGVTVDSKRKNIRYKDRDFSIVDLPGTYSLVPYSEDEKITNDFLQNNPSSVVFNIIDRSNLERNLYLSLQLLEQNFLVVNVLNETVKTSELDIKKFNNSSCFNGILVNAKNKQSVFDCLDFPPKNKGVPYLNDSLIIKLAEVFKAEDPSKNSKVCAIKFLEKDENFLKNINISKNGSKKLELLVKNMDTLNFIAALRFNYITSILKDCYQVKRVFAKHKIDNLFLNRFLALPIFVLLFALVFYLTFSSFGLYLSEGLKKLTAICFNPLILWLKTASPAWVESMISTAIVGGIGTLFSFLPQIVFLYIFLNILEESGYMSRVAFMFEDILGKVGLNGKSIFCFLMGYGCATTTIMTTRTLEENSRIKTAMSIPLISCSAKLPLFVILCSTFFKGNVLIIVLLYFVCLCMAIAFAGFLNLFYPQKSNFILEFAPLKKVSLKKVIKEVFKTIKEFVLRVGLLLLSLSVLIWFLQSFSFSLKFIASSGGVSILQEVSQFLSFIFVPLGLSNWGIVASFITGFIAKEMIVSTMAIINSVPLVAGLEKALEFSFLSPASVIHLTAGTAFIFMLFALTYLPCVSTFAMLKKEVGRKNAILSVTLQFGFTYVVCGLVYLFYNLLNTFGLNVLWWSFGAVILVLSALFVFAKKHKCSSCRGGNCKSCELFEPKE